MLAEKYSINKKVVKQRKRIIKETASIVIQDSIPAILDKCKS